MKKLFIFLITLLTVVLVNAQSIQRTMVIQEIGTGTWCQYCPGAAMGADDLIANGCAVAVIEYHNGDGFTNAASNARISYYGISGFPTAFFDGTLSYVGGSNTQSMYPQYLPLYNQRHAIQSPLSIDIAGTNSGSTYNLTLSLHKLADIIDTTLRVQVVLTESNIAYSWQGQNHLNYVERLMAPNELGSVVNFGNGDMQIINVSFTKDAAWVASNCEIVVFLQNNATKEILNGAKVALNSLQAPPSVNFSGNPTTGCGPLTVNYTDLSAGVTTWQWSFPGGTPSTSSVQNPVVVYSTTGVYDATLTAWSGIRGNKNVKTGFMNVSMAPAAPGTPAGNTSLCSNPGIEVYTTSGASGSISYNWDLQPPSAGTVANNGISCSINWNASFAGTAQLKVQGSNTCGTGAWSPTLAITLSQQPTQAGTPTGPDQLCINPPNSDYATSGGTPATAYIWDLTPSTAGVVNASWTTCTIDWSNTFTGTAQLKVSAMNGGCQGAWSNAINITINQLPTAYPVTGGGSYCATGGSGLPVGVNNSQTSTNYTLYLNGNATTNTIPGTGNAISFGNQTTAGTYTVVAATTTGSCTTNMTGNAVIGIDPQAPNAPAPPTGSLYPESGTVVNYTTTGATYATSYDWSVVPSNAGTFAGTTTTGTITWSSTFVGQATIQVKGINSCGNSSNSSLTVNVVTVGLNDLNKNKALLVFPNPVKGTVNLISDIIEKGEVNVVNSLGSSVITLHNVNLTKGYKLDVSKLQSGVYFITVSSGNSNEVVKITVQ